MAYTKLSGKQRDLSGYKQLWLGEDHILLVQSSRFTEQYRKFALSDIQAIVVTSQPTAVSLRAMMAILMAMLLGGALLTDSNGLKIALALFAAIPFVILVSDMARGPRVACRLCTEVSAELLPITRASAFRGFQSRIVPAVEAAQGGRLDPGAAVENLRTFAPQPVKRETPPAGGTLFAILSALLLANAGFLVAAWLAKRPDFYAAFVSFAFGETVIGFFLLRSLRDARQEFVARTVAALSMGLSILDFLIGIGLFAAYIVQVSEASRQGGSAAQFSWTRIPYIQYWTYYAAGWRALTGITGAIRYVASRLAPAAPRGNESQP